MQTFLLSTLLKLSFFLSDLNTSFQKFTTLLSLQPTLLATLALPLMNTLPSLTKSLHFLNHIRELRCICPYLDLGAPDSRKRLLENSVCFKIQPQIDAKSLLFHTPFYIVIPGKRKRCNHFHNLFW